MIFLPKLTSLLTSVVLSAALLITGFTLLPTAQDPGQQTALFTSAVITTTAQTSVFPCGQGAGSIGRKTLAVWNDVDSDGEITVTVELRDTQAGENFTTGYLAVGGLADGLLSSDVATPAEAGGAFCQVSAVSASTSTITVTLRRE
jgi:hypothetical protein